MSIQFGAIISLRKLKSPGTQGETVYIPINRARALHNIEVDMGHPIAPNSNVLFVVKQPGDEIGTAELQYTKASGRKWHKDVRIIYRDGKLKAVTNGESLSLMERAQRFLPTSWFTASKSNPSGAEI